MSEHKYQEISARLDELIESQGYDVDEAYNMIRIEFGITDYYAFLDTLRNSLSCAWSL